MRSSNHAIKHWLITSVITFNVITKSYLSSSSTSLLLYLFFMQLKTLHQGNKCSWHNCSWLMSFPPNRNWFNLHDIYLTIQSQALWQSSHTYWTYRRIIISPIDCRDLTRVIYVCWHAGRPSLFAWTSALSGQSWHRSRCVYGHYACDPIVQGQDTNVHHAVAFSLARSPSLIDFPLLCHCGGLFKHTFCDIRLHTVWYLKLQLKEQTGEEQKRGCSTI